jgi:hypothetical protein
MHEAHGGNLRFFIENYTFPLETKFGLLMMTKNSSYNPSGRNMK